MLTGLPPSPLCPQTAALDDATADMFKKELISRIQMLEIIQQVLLSTGLIVFALCLISYCVVRRRRSKSSFWGIRCLLWSKVHLSCCGTSNLFDIDLHFFVILVLFIMFFPLIPGGGILWFFKAKELNSFAKYNLKCKHCNINSIRDFWKQV